MDFSLSGWRRGRPRAVAVGLLRGCAFAAAGAVVLTFAGCGNAPPAGARGDGQPATVAWGPKAGQARGAYPWTHAEAVDNNSQAASAVTVAGPIGGGAVIGAGDDAYAFVPPASATSSGGGVGAAPRGPAPMRVEGTVVLDAGHGGHDAGAEGMASGIGPVREKDVTLAVTLAAAEDLRRRGARVYLTRSDDGFVSLSERSRFANRYPGAAFVSIHANATATGQNRPAWMVAGVETYVLHAGVTDEYRTGRAVEARHGRLPVARQADYAARYAAICRGERQKSEGLARLLQSELVRGLGDEDRGVKRKDLAVLRETVFCPAVLVEVGFLTHAPTAAKLADDAYRRRVARAIADGIARHLAGE